MRGHGTSYLNMPLLYWSRYQLADIADRTWMEILAADNGAAFFGNCAGSKKLKG